MQSESEGDELSLAEASEGLGVTQNKALNKHTSLKQFTNLEQGSKVLRYSKSGFTNHMI
jgi:hypothetical protein